MDVYMYQAALYCEKCGESIKGDIKPDDDSDNYPQGPYSDGGGDADCPQHCDSCGLFLENPLTSEGERFVREVIQGHADGKPGNRKASEEWGEFYDIHPEYPEGDE